VKAFSQTFSKIYSPIDNIFEKVINRRQGSRSQGVKDSSVKPKNKDFRIKPLDQGALNPCAPASSEPSVVQGRQAWSLYNLQ